MIVKADRGSRAHGLMAYLVKTDPFTRRKGENVHSHPQIVGGDVTTMVRWGDTGELTHDDAMRIADSIDVPFVAAGSETPKHVYHFSLAIGHFEGELPRETWNDIANMFTREMGLSSDNPDESCRWVALHHGKSDNGNDHIHIVADRVREDGTAVTSKNERLRAMAARKKIEVEFGLKLNEGEKTGRHHRDRKRAEYLQETVGGKFASDRRKVERVVRAAASSAQDEAEFVRRLRKSRLIVRPKFGDGGVVTGYSVKLRDTKYAFSGGKLAHDLSLPRLRKEYWADRPLEEAFAQTQRAVAEWESALKFEPVVAPGREAREFRPAEFKRLQAKVDYFNEQMLALSPDDHAGWNSIARRVAGAASIWSGRYESAGPGALTETAHVTGDLGSSDRAATRHVDGGSVLSDLALTAVYMGMKDKNSAVAQALFFRQLVKTLQSFHDVLQAHGELRRASAVRELARDQLVPLSQQIHQRLASTQVKGVPVDSTMNHIQPEQQRQFGVEHND